MSKPREWWLAPLTDKTFIAHDEKPDTYFDDPDPIHVIEYAAYEALMEQAMKLKRGMIEALTKEMSTKERGSYFKLADDFETFLKEIGK